MASKPGNGSWIGRFIRDRRGNVLPFLGLMMGLLVLAVGVGVDYTRAVQFKTALQGMADSAALAGASVFSSSSKKSTAEQVADNYMDLQKVRLPANNNFSYTATGLASSVNSTTDGYSVTVTASAQLKSTFLSLFSWKNLPIRVTAKAQKNVIVQVQLKFGNFCSSASDKNTVYYYIIPSTLTDDQVDSYIPAKSDLVQLWSNYPDACVDSSNGNDTPTVGISQKIGFALENVTGGIHGYGKNAYGASQGSDNWFYSNIPGMSKYNYPNLRGDANCSLQVATVDSKGNASPTNDKCFASDPAHATPACSDSGVAGKTIEFFWNDMGGGKDDLDYNDAYYTMTCPSSSASTASNVVLIN